MQSMLGLGVELKEHMSPILHYYYYYHHHHHLLYAGYLYIYS